MIILQCEIQKISKFKKKIESSVIESTGKISFLKLTLLK